VYREELRQELARRILKYSWAEIRSQPGRLSWRFYARRREGKGGLRLY